MDTTFTPTKNTKRFGLLAVLEGISYLAFFITMPLKYFMEMPMPNKIVGMAHGFLFIAYVLFAFIVVREQKWSMKRFVIFFVASLIPFATFYIEKKYLKTSN